MIFKQHQIISYFNLAGALGALGLGFKSLLNAVSDASASRLFYLAELTSPFILTDSSSGSVEITVDSNYELFGNEEGTVVESMAIAPFVFQPTFVSN